MLPRILEAEVMDTPEEAIDYNTMDHSVVNALFVDDLLQAIAEGPLERRRTSLLEPLGVLDVGTGTALIPIELCRRPGAWRVTAVDLAQAMLDVAAANLASTGLEHRITLKHLDAKRLPFADGRFDVVMSNSIIHHIAEPRVCLAEMVRVAAPGGLLFVRDLLRPADSDELERLVDLYARDANFHQRGMFRASLHAALTLEEVRLMAAELSITPDQVRQTTDRHWTIACQL